MTTWTDTLLEQPLNAAAENQLTELRVVERVKTKKIRVTRRERHRPVPIKYTNGCDDSGIR